MSDLDLSYHVADLETGEEMACQELYVEVTKAEVMVEEDEENVEASEAVSSSRDRTSENEAGPSRQATNYLQLVKRTGGRIPHGLRRTGSLFGRKRQRWWRDHSSTSPCRSKRVSSYPLSLMIVVLLERSATNVRDVIEKLNV